MKTNYEKLMKINYEKLLIFYLPFTTGKAMLGALMERRNTERYEPCSDAE